MARPRKWKRVCSLPENNLFGSLGQNLSDKGSLNLKAKDNTIIMTVEEYETIRLIDFENLTQEECALRMNIARATVQKLYDVARKKIASSLVEGCLLKIEGGDYKLYDNEELENCSGCRKMRCGHGRNRNL